VPRLFRPRFIITSNFHAVFPRLAHSSWKIKSPWDDRYKCIAYAAGRTDVIWWPVDGVPGVYWPPSAPLEDSVDAFVKAFATIGYMPCQSRKFEFGYQKVAIYAASNNQALHMARQHFWGRGWLSKCGQLEDILHSELESIEGDPSPLATSMGSYGVVNTVLKRSWASALICGGLFHSSWYAFRFWLFRIARRSWNI